MAFQDYFELAPAYNPDTEQLVADAPFQVFAVGDLAYATPLAVTSADSGAALTPFVSNSLGMLPAFRVVGAPTQVILKSGSFTTLVTSRYGAVVEAGLDSATVAAAIAAGSTAATAAAAAADSAEAAEAAAAAAAAIPAVTDGLMTAVANNPESAFAIQQAAAIAEAVAAGGGGGGGDDGFTVRWNSTTDSWPARPADAPFGVVFLSTNDPTATEPADVNLKQGDVWRRHPDAV